MTDPAPHAPGASSVEMLFKRLVAGDRVALARAITLMESQRTGDGPSKAELIERCTDRAGNSIRVGISGMPGAGKSTFIERMGLDLIEEGRRLAVLAVDPSSRRTGGSILGDKTRMDRLAARQEAFIRPSPNSGILGGVAEMTRETILLCEAAGYDTVLVETVGVGQAEFGVHDMVDYLLLLTIPGSGDALQGIKRGIIEMADAVVVNKADGDRSDDARRAASDLKTALRGGSVRVATASAVTGEGIQEAWHAIVEEIERRSASGEFQERRQRQQVDWFENATDVFLRARLDTDAALSSARRALRSAVIQKELHPVAAAARFVDMVRPKEDASGQGSDPVP